MNSNTHGTTSYHVSPGGQESKCHVDVSQTKYRMDKTNLGNMGNTISFAEFSVSTQCIFLLVRSFIDLTFCGIFVRGPLQFKCQFDHVRFDLLPLVITRVLTICHVKLTQSTALEQKRLDLRSSSCVLPNLWLLLVYIRKQERLYLKTWSALASFPCITVK